jgi:hypothetical protein
MCGEIWNTRDEFLDDSSLELEGYGADFEIIEDGLFYFTHRAPGCSSTMALKAKEFLNLYTGERFRENKMGSDECPRLCLERNRLDRCPNSCEYAFVREVMQIIKKRHKRVSAPTVSDMKN